MAQINPRTFADAKQLGDNVYELILTNWGNRGMGQDLNNGSIQYPPIKTNDGTIPGTVPKTIPIEGELLLPPIPSLSAIAIAPRSSVDRCILHFPSLPNTPSTLSQQQPNNEIETGVTPGFVNQGGILETEQVLAVGAPLIGQLNGPIIIRAHRAHWFSDKYTVSVPGPPKVEKPFGTAIPPNISGAIVWNNPELRLLLYLNGRAALPPSIRAPLYVTQVLYAFTLVPAPGPVFFEELVVVAPVMGRKFVRVDYRGNALIPAGVGGDQVVRITGTWAHTQPSGSPTGDGFAIHENFEVELVPPTTVVAGTSVEFPIDIVHPGISYLMIKATPTQILNVARVSIHAFD